VPAVSVANPPPSETVAAQGKTGAVLPFVTSSWDHEEPIIDFSVPLSSTASNQGPIDVNAFGWLRGVWFRVTATGGSSSAAVAGTQDAPWNVIDQVTLLNPNGQPYVGPLSGYNCAVVRRFGGYHGWYDNPLSGIFQPVQTAAGGTAGNFDFFLYLPSQLVNRNGLGSLANENAKATYKVTWIQNPSSTVYSTPPTATLPTIRYRMYLDAWAPPPPEDILGNRTSQVPPGNGTIQYWTSNGRNPVPNGYGQLVFTRKGQYIRTWVFIARNNTGARDPGVMPSTNIQLVKDGYIMTNLTLDRWAEKMTQWYGLGQTGISGDLSPQNSASQWYGVFVYTFAADLLPIPGSELRSRYLPTLQATRLELDGQYGIGSGTAPGTVEILTNDVAVPGDIFTRFLL
jgi:hypothetical protein